MLYSLGCIIKYIKRRYLFWEQFFKLKERNTDVRTEIMAGITTFMTMAYILAVNPSILGDAGMDKGAVFTATALASGLACLLMALLANLPFALSAGMGLNAYMAYTVVLGMGYSWEIALTAVFAEGIIFIILSLTNVREAIFNAIPTTLKVGVPSVSASSSASSVCRTPTSPWTVPHWSLFFPSVIHCAAEPSIPRVSLFFWH